MTTLDSSLPAAASGDVAVEVVLETWWNRLDTLLARLGERLNPILVKEARQALKSRQFLITFTLVLAFAWMWSMLGPSLIGPGIYYSSQGPFMFCGYYVVLSFPLLVIVPFSAFRSLAAEREDGTFELLSVTTLRPRQIVSGKLGSAVLQMLVYFSAVAPCLGFTYMLKGVDFPTILFVLFYTFLASLGLSLVGLVVATATEEKHWQIVLSVFLLFGLGLAFFIGLSLVLGSAVLSEIAAAIGDRYFWIGNVAFLTAYASYFALFYFAAAAQLTFASDNRSSVLRIVMVAQQVLFAGWMGWVFLEDDSPDWEVILVFLIFSGIHWYVMGAFMAGESGDLSERVKRRLPQSFLGRAFFTWFNPGPATGYVFALTNLAAAVLIGSVGLFAWVMFYPGQRMGWPSGDPLQVLLAFSVIGFCYVAIYLGVGRLLVAAVRKLTQAGMLLSVLVQILLLLAGCGIPMTIHLMTPGLRDDYALIEISNPIWTLVELGDQGSLTFEMVTVLFLLPPAAALVFLFNLPGVVAAVRHVRIAKPRRVAEEDALLEALHAPPPQPVPSSPWD